MRRNGAKPFAVASACTCRGKGRAARSQAGAPALGGKGAGVALRGRLAVAGPLAVWPRAAKPLAWRSVPRIAPWGMGPRPHVAKRYGCSASVARLHCPSAACVPHLHKARSFLIDRQLGAALCGGRSPLCTFSGLSWRGAVCAFSGLSWRGAACWRVLGVALC